MNKNFPKVYWIEQRNEMMRKARNAQFYAKASDISEIARMNWLATCRTFVQEAREINLIVIARN